MLGYLRAENPGVLDPPKDGWCNHGRHRADRREGFVTIKGRAKRFAKVAGEMVPLGAVEELVARVWPSAMHAVVAVPDAKRGEQLVLITDQADASRARSRPRHAKRGFPRSSCRALLRQSRRSRFSARENRLRQCRKDGDGEHLGVRTLIPLMRVTLFREPAFADR